MIMNKKLIIAFCLFFVGSLSINAQTEQKPQELEEPEVVQMTKEEKKAIINKRREGQKAVNEVRMQNKANSRNKRNLEMFEALKMDDKQIAAYNKIQEENRNDIKKAAKKRKDDKIAFAKEMQEIREKNSASLKKLFSEEQFKLYMDFNENNGRKSMNGKEVIKKVESPK